MTSYGHCQHCRRASNGKPSPCSTEERGNAHDTVCGRCDRAKPPGLGAYPPPSDVPCNRQLGKGSRKTKCPKPIIPSCRASYQRCAWHCESGHRTCPPL